MSNPNSPVALPYADGALVRMDLQEDFSGDEVRLRATPFAVGADDGARSISEKGATIVLEVSGAWHLS